MKETWERFDSPQFYSSAELKATPDNSDLQDEVVLKRVLTSYHDQEVKLSRVQNKWAEIEKEVFTVFLFIQCTIKKECELAAGKVQLLQTLHQNRTTLGYCYSTVCFESSSIDKHGLHYQLMSKIMTWKEMKIALG